MYIFYPPTDWALVVGSPLARDYTGTAVLRILTRRQASRWGGAEDGDKRAW